MEGTVWEGRENFEGTEGSEGIAVAEGRIQVSTRLLQVFREVENGLTCGG